MLKNILLTALLSLLFLTGCSTKEELAIINEKDKYGVSKNDDEIIIKPIYDELSNFDDRKNKNTKMGHPHIVNLHWLHNYYGNEYTIVKYRDKYGVVTKDNEMVVKPIYDSITKLFNGFFIIKLDDKYGYMNDEFEVVQKPIFKNVREFPSGVTFVQSNTNGKWGCLTKDMELKINGVYDEIYNLYNGFARVVKSGRWGYLDDSCNVVVETEYDYVYDFSEEYAKVIKYGQIKYINSEGEEIIKEDISTNEENF